MFLVSKLNSIDIRKFKSNNGKTFEENLYAEAKRLKNCIQKRLNEYFYLNPPTMYTRTGGLRSSLKIEDIVKIRIAGNSLQIQLFFNEKANHMSGDGITTLSRSAWKGTSTEVNTAFLLNYGYRVKKDVWFKNYENFGWRDGAYFVENGINDFNMTNKLNINIEIKKPNGYSV